MADYGPYHLGSDMDNLTVAVSNLLHLTRRGQWEEIDHDLCVVLDAAGRRLGGGEVAVDYLLNCPSFLHARVATRLNVELELPNDIAILASDLEAIIGFVRENEMIIRSLMAS